MSGRLRFMPYFTRGCQDQISALRIGEALLGKVFEGGTFGLVRAWYHVGAPQIVMSLWNVSDKATKVLMISFMNKMAAKVPAEYALQQAMIETRSEFSSTALWAGFAVFGQPTAP